MKTPFHSHGTGLSLVAALVLLASAAQAAQAAQATDAAALQACRAVAEPSARLACYDALALRAVPAAPAAPAPGSAAPAVGAAAPAVVQTFGQERREEPQAISSHIPGAFEGWGPTSRIKLANGQVWQVVDGSEGVYYLQSPKVTVKRALGGGFQLDIEGAKRTPRVRRVE